MHQKIISSTICFVESLSMSSPKIVLNFPYDDNELFMAISIPDTCASSDIIPFPNRKLFSCFLIIFFPFLNNVLNICCLSSTDIFSPSIFILFISFKTQNASYSRDALGKTSSPFMYEHLLTILFINSSDVAL